MYISQWIITSIGTFLSACWPVPWTRGINSDYYLLLNIRATCHQNYLFSSELLDVCQRLWFAVIQPISEGVLTFLATTIMFLLQQGIDTCFFPHRESSGSTKEPRWSALTDLEISWLCPMTAMREMTAPKGWWFDWPLFTLHIQGLKPPSSYATKQIYWLCLRVDF